MVIAEAAASGGPLTPFCRLDPAGRPAGRGRALPWTPGAAGIKLHPRGEAFQLDTPRSRTCSRWPTSGGCRCWCTPGAASRRWAATRWRCASATRGLRLILAHACISDLAWIWRAASDLPNLFFDTSWWSPSDLLALCTLVPAGPDPVRQRRALRHARVRRRTEPALRAAGRAERGADPAGVRRPDRAAPGRRGAPTGRRPADGDAVERRPAARPRVHLPGGRDRPDVQRPSSRPSRWRWRALACTVGDDAPQAQRVRGRAGPAGPADALPRGEPPDGRPTRFAPGLQFLVAAARRAHTRPCRRAV